MKLQPREIPQLTFRRKLPEFLGPGKDKDGNPVECYIEIEARAGGAINPVYMRGIDELTIKARIRDRQTAKIEEDEAFVRKQRADHLEFGRDRLGLLFDACVIAWRSNIQDDKEPIICDRERFMGLAEARVPEIAEMFVAFEKEVTEAGKLVRAAQDAAIKN